MQLLVGHCDTVWPVGTVEKMPVRVEGDTLRGPGVFDMKGGLVQMLYALRALKDLGLRPPAVSVAVINSDEEIGSPDSTSLIRRLARHAVRAFILEPAFGRAGKLKTARKASGGFTITVKGRAAHAGVNPEEGASAILEMSHQIQRLFALNDAARGITVNVGTIDGGLRSNVVAAEVRATVDVRVRTRQDAAEVEAAIRGLGPVNPATTIQVDGGIEQPPMEPLPRNQALWRLARDLGRRLGLDLAARPPWTSRSALDSDLVGEFCRLAVHPTGRHRGIGKLLLSERIQRVQERLQVGLVEARTTHPCSLRIAEAHQFAVVGFLPERWRLRERESLALLVRYFGNALDLRDNHPRIIPEVHPVAHMALENCSLPRTRSWTRTPPPIRPAGISRCRS